MNIKLKKRIAIEVLLFFGTVILAGLFYVSILLWNSYHYNSIDRLSEKTQNLKKELSAIPQDKIGDLYSELKMKMIINFKVDNDSFAIPKKEEKEFLIAYPNAKPLHPYPEKYSIFRLSKLKRLYGNLQSEWDDFSISYDDFVIKMKSENYLRQIHRKLIDEWPNFTVPYNRFKEDMIASEYVFDFVQINEFRNLMLDTSYSNKFYDFASRENKIGTQQEYFQLIKESLKFNEDSDTQTIQIKNKINNNGKEINRKRYRIVDKAEIINYSLFAWIIILGLLYPVRLIIILVRWSINTIKE